MKLKNIAFYCRMILLASIFLILDKSVWGQIVAFDLTAGNAATAGIAANFPGQGRVMNISGLTSSSFSGTNGQTCYAWNSVGNDSWVTSAFSTAGYFNITGSFQMKANTNLGPRDFKIQYSLDGNIWTDVTTTTTNPTYSGINFALSNSLNTYNFSLPAECENTTSVYVRWVQNSAYQLNGVTPIGTTSNYNASLKGVSIAGYAIAAPPSTQASNISIISVTPTTIKIGCTNGNGNNRIIKINTSNSFTDPTDDYYPTANTTYSESGEQVIYNGAGSSVTVTVTNTTNVYWFRVYDFNKSNNLTRYNITTASGNPKQCKLENIHTPTISGVKLIKADMGATITTPSALTILERGVFWSTETPVDENANLVPEISGEGGIYIISGIEVERGSTIYFKGYVTNESGTILSEESSFSNIPIFTGTGDWETASNWNVNEIPGASVSSYATNGSVDDSPIINGTCTLTANNEVTNLTINSGKLLNIGPNAGLTVNGEIFKSTGNTDLIIKSDATGTGSLIEHSGIPATVQRYIANDFKWHFISSPVTDQPIWPAFAPTPVNLSWGPYNSGSPYNWDFYYFNPNASTTNELYWVNLRKDETGAYNGEPIEATGSGAGFGAAIPKFDVGRGYLVAYNIGSPTHIFDGGNLNAGDITQEITNGSNPNNLVGNPYPSYIDWTSESWSRTDLATATGGGYDYWIWNDNLTKGNYGVCNSITGTGTNNVTNNIAPGQAFFIKAASSGSLGMSDAIRVHSEQPFLKNTNAETNLVRLKIENTANTYSDEMIVEFNADFSGGGSDKFWSFYTEAPELYSVKDGNNYSIDRYNTLTDDMKVDIAAKTGVAANYTITATNIADFTLRDKVYLLDLKTGIKTNLKQTPSYSFVGTPDDDRNRFQLIFGTSIGVDEETSSDITIYASENIIYIRNDKANEPYTVMVSNMLGQIITRTKLAGNTLNQIELNSVPGIYVVTVYSEGSLFSKKVVVK